MLLTHQCVNKNINEEIRKYLKTNENGNTTFQNLWDTPKAVLRGKFTTVQAFLKKQEKSQRNNLTYHLKELEKEQTKLKVSRRRKIIKISEEINRIVEKKKRKYQRNQKIFFENISKLIHH